MRNGCGLGHHRTAETVHHINTRRKGQHPLTIHLILLMIVYPDFLSTTERRTVRNDPPRLL
jgi:hypothetical protein